MRNWLLDEKMDDMIMERNMAVADQDIALLNDVIPVMTPPTLTKEIFVPADLIIGEYRNSLDEYVKKGFKIDMQKVKDTQHQTAYAVPSPARRKEKNWVLDPVPLIKE